MGLRSLLSRAAGAASSLLPPRWRRASLSSSGSPLLRQVLRSNFTGIPGGSYGFWGDNQRAEWLGPYTPEHVALWQLKLMRKDPQLRLGMAAVKAPFFAIKYRLRGGDATTRAFVQRTLLDTPLFREILRSILNSLDFGFQTNELLWDLEDVTFDEDGPGGLRRPITRLQAFVLRALNDVDPERVICRWDEWGRFTGVSVSGQLLEPEKCLHAVHDREWANHYGCAHPKPAYNPWFWCNFLYLWKMRYCESRITPALVATAPFDFREDEDEPQDQVEESALDLIGRQALAFRNGSVAAIPYEPDEKGNNKFSITMVRDEGRVEQFITAINHQQALKLRAVCLPERTATQDTQTGSFAMVREHVDFFLMILETIKLQTVLPQFDFLVRTIVRANFGRSAPVPIMDASALARQNEQAIFDLVAKSLEVPITLDDGRTYTPAQLVDYQAIFDQVGVASHSPSEVARKQAVEILPPGDKSAPLPAPTPAAPRKPAVAGLARSFARTQMPQIDAAEVEDFLAYLGSLGVPVALERVPLAKLRSSQVDLNLAKVARIKKRGLARLLEGPPPFVSGDMYVLDGHHRAAAIGELDPQAVARCWVIGLDQEQAIAIAQQYPGATFRGIRDGAQPAAA